MRRRHRKNAVLMNTPPPTPTPLATLPPEVKNSHPVLGLYQRSAYLRGYQRTQAGWIKVGH